jgi:HK97 family phage major capsid protein
MSRIKTLAAFAAFAALAVTSAFAAGDPAAFHVLAQLALQPGDGALLAVLLPTTVASGISSGYERKGGGGSDDDGSPAIAEIQRLMEDQGKAWKSFKETNDALLKAKADGKVIGDLEAKLDKINADMDRLSEMKQQVDDLLVKLARPGGMGVDSKSAETLAAEVKGFNDSLRADYQSKGRVLPGAVSADQYQQYKSAMQGLIRHGDLERLSSDERKSLSAGSDPDGGFLMPTPTVGRIVARVWEKSIVRQLATVQTLSGDALEGINDNGEAGGGWVSEQGARDETATPNIGKYRVEAHEMYAEPRVTQKLLDDAAVDIEAWLAMKVGDKFARIEGLAFWRGNGVGQSRGMCDYPTAATGDDTRTWGTLEHVNTGASGAFHTTKADPLQDLIGAFRDEYLQNATWVMRREVRTLIRKLKEATSDRYLWEPSLQAGQPDQLLGYAARVDQYLPALASNSLSLAFGDFREGYTVVDRLGVRTLRDPFTAKPFVKFYTTRRTGGGVVNFEAIKFLRFGT